MEISNAVDAIMNETFKCGGSMKWIYIYCGQSEIFNNSICQFGKIEITRQLTDTDRIHVILDNCRTSVFLDNVRIIEIGL